MELPPDIPPEAAVFLQAIGYLDPDRLKTGDPVPPYTISRLDTREPATVGGPKPQPTVLIFGSFT